jgi:D-alanyl-D-alanine dipeptidase
VIATALLLGLVDATAVVPRLKLDIRYATADNFTHQRLYPRARCLLQAPVAARLAEVQRELRARGRGLLVYDCYRPLSVQRLMWRIVPNPDYVADPKDGSRHNRGAAIDVTLVDQHGRPLPMPSAWDEFTPRAHRDYAGATEAQRRNRALLEEVMTRHGFVGLPTEWWHFDAVDWQSYPLSDEPL